jgi:hypothetical protein
LGKSFAVQSLTVLGARAAVDARSGATDHE